MFKMDYLFKKIEKKVLLESYKGAFLLYKKYTFSLNS